jgi:type IV fimbrial biogenesis protein FimU
MRYRAKGFSLIELLIAISIVGILGSVAVPSFTRAIENSKADSDVDELLRALNYVRLEAMNRGVNLQLLPAASGAGWNTALKVVASSDTSTTLRTVPAMNSSATLSAPNVTSLEFSNLGGLSKPSTAVAMTYTLGSVSKTVNVCLNGRIVSGGSC